MTGFFIAPEWFLAQGESDADVPKGCDKGADCFSTDGLVARGTVAWRADQDANRSAGLHSDRVDIERFEPPMVSRACPLPV